MAGKVTVGLAMRHRLQWLIHLRAQWLTEGRWAPRLHSCKEYGTLYMPRQSATCRWNRNPYKRTIKLVDCPALELVRGSAVLRAHLCSYCSRHACRRRGPQCDGLAL